MLVDISTINPRILLAIKYATSDNFVGRPLYSCAKAFVQEKVADMLNEAQIKLEQQGLGLQIFDAYRPLPVQFELWDIVPDERYVANPQKGSIHNTGAAVDVTLVDKHGVELAMPTGFDEFSEKAHITYEDLPEEVLKNRELLIATMVSVGFEPFATEWWHFNAPGDYPVLSTTFEELQALL